MNTTHLIIVVPCYNEESVLPETIRQLSGVLNRMLENGKISIGKILFVDDGSKDKTWNGPVHTAMPPFQSMPIYRTMSMLSKR